MQRQNHQLIATDELRVTQVGSVQARPLNHRQLGQHLVADGQRVVVVDALLVGRIQRRFQRFFETLQRGGRILHPEAITLAQLHVGQRHDEGVAATYALNLHVAACQGNGLGQRFAQGAAVRVDLQTGIE